MNIGESLLAAMIGCVVGLMIVVWVDPKQKIIDKCNSQPYVVIDNVAYVCRFEEVTPTKSGEPK